MRYIIEEEKRLPVSADYDVVVAGGGIAGIAASLAAARQGARVLLLEREYLLGGLATLGLVTAYLPLCDGNGHQVSFGIAEELLRLAIQYGADGISPDAWLDENRLEDRRIQRFYAKYNANMFALLSERLLLSSGVDVLYGTSVCGGKVDNGRVKALYIENKSGRSAVLLRAVIDATGDADVCNYAGAKTRQFAQKNVLAAWYYSRGSGDPVLHTLGISDIPDDERDPSEPALAFLNDKRYSGLEAAELSQMAIDAHAVILDRFLRETESPNACNLTNIPALPQIRMTRCLLGQSVLNPDAFQYRRDSIGLVPNWKCRGPVYEIPFSSLYGNDVSNLLVAGRCISTNDAMWDITRAIPACAVTGEAAGTAAALTDNFPALGSNILPLQQALSENGVRIHVSQIPGLCGGASDKYEQWHIYE